MSNKSSIAYILATGSTPRAHASTSCHLLCRPWPPSPRSIRPPQPLFDYDPVYLPAIRPLTAYLRHPRDASRVDCVRIPSIRPPRLPNDERRDVTMKISDEQATHQTMKTLPATKKSSKYCMVEGCTSRAKHARRCWKHGGSVKCKVPTCANRAKSKGVCWSHGGGSPCTVEDCDTIAVSNGFCWAHGGGKRCRERGCARPAYERTHNYCAQHYENMAYQRRQSFSTCSN